MTLLTAVLFTLLLPLSARAQEDKGSFEAENLTKDPLRQDQETPSGVENPENRLTRNIAGPNVQEPAATVTVVRDSELKNAKPSPKMVEKAPKDEEKVQKKEEDPLSFNFLYYIIEKFKLSDIVE